MKRRAAFPIFCLLAAGSAISGWAAFAAGAPAPEARPGVPALRTAPGTPAQAARPGGPAGRPAAPIVPPAHIAALNQAIPDAKNVRRMAVLRGLDKIKGVATDISAPAGVPVHYGSLTLTLRYCHTVPPEEPPETTAFLQVDEVDPLQPNAAPKRLFSGWMFASTPALNALEHGVYDVWVITCRTDAPEPVEDRVGAETPLAPPDAAGPAPAVRGPNE